MEGNSRGFPHFLGKVFDAVEHVVTFGLGHYVLGRIDAIGVDEIQYANGHKYLTLFEAAESTEAIGYSHRDFGLVVQAFHNTAERENG